MATEVKNEDPITHKGAMVEEKMEVPMVIPRTLNHNIAPTKVDLLDEFTDMLTDDVRNTEHSPETVTDERKSPTFEMSSTGSGQFATNFTPVATTAYLPHEYSNSIRPNSVPNLSRQSPDFIHPTESRTSPMQGYPSTSTVQPCENDSQTEPESEYVNEAKIEKPKVKPKPAVRKKPIADISSAPESHNPNSYGAVRTKVLANKSAQERAKFEETINKALTSLPQLPKPIAKK
uniref:Uncharacterized protein n=1 Tax=Ciona savignyi TaxID=51511 RepID=H2ZMW9_CIOSA